MNNANRINTTSSAAPNAPADGSEHFGHHELLRRIDRGIHFTFLLSFVALPIAYLTQVFLARTSSDAVGIYGAILLWSSFALSFFYFGGNAVLAKFLPDLSLENRRPFLRSYSIVIFGFTVLGVLVIALSSNGLRFAMGFDFPNILLPILLLIALVNIFQQVLISALKALLELVTAQLLIRISTAGYALSFGLLLIFDKAWFRTHLLSVIAAVHISLLGLSIVLATLCLKRTLKPASCTRRWYLPPGFWRFSSIVQLSSAVTFVHAQVDRILVLMTGGVSGLGLYYVLSQLAWSIQLISGFFLDSMLPVFTNVLTCMGADATRSVYSRGARLNQIIVTGCALLLMCFHRLVLATFGTPYLDQWHVLLALALFMGINSLGSLNAYVLTATGRMSSLLFSQVLQVVVFLVLFMTLGGRESLFMLALAQGLAMMVGLAAVIVATSRVLPLSLRIPREFWASLAVLLAVTSIAGRFGPLSLIHSSILFLVAQIVFVLIGGYDWSEIRSLVALFGLPAAALPGLSRPHGFSLCLPPHSSQLKNLHRPEP